MGITVVKRDGTREPYDANKINLAIEHASTGLDPNITWVTQIASELELTLFDGITTQQLDEAVIQVALQNVKDDPAFDTVAARLLLKTIYKRVLGDYADDAEVARPAPSALPRATIERGVAEALLDPRLGTMFDLDRLAAALDPSHDELLKYIGVVTLNNRYGIKARNNEPLEVPQYFWMRIAMGLSLNEADPTTAALGFYAKMSRLDYLAAGSTLVNAGTAYPQLSNCFVLEMQDDIEHIAKTTRDVMWLTKGTGGIGLSVTKLRAQGSPIRSNNTTSTGPIPFMHTIDSILRAVSRGGKKFGALCFYMENWHLDFPEFLDLRQNSGDPYRRTRTANTAVWISDEFMKRVQNDDAWYLFDPLEVADLNELTGKAFSERYAFYVAEAEAGRIRAFKRIGAREQFKAILMSLQTTSHPWLTWKDTINNRALNNNTGTIHSSNLCTEITLPQDRDNVSVCNLASINLSRHLVTDEHGRLGFDWAQIASSAKSAVRQLDNLIDITISSVDEADHSNDQNRADRPGRHGLHRRRRAPRLLLRERGGVRPDRRGDGARLLRRDRGVGRPGPGARGVPELPGLALERGPGAVRHDRHHGGRARRARARRPHHAARLGRAARAGQGRHAQRDADGDRADGLHRPRRRHHAGPRPAVLADLQPRRPPRASSSRSTATWSARCSRPGLWERTREAILRSQGDIQHIAEIPDDIKETYKTSFQLSPYAFLEVAARAQKWIDQAISRNMYLETRDLGDMMSIYSAAWERGVKTTYYLHMKPRHTAEQSTVRVNKAETIDQGAGAASTGRRGFGSERAAACGRRTDRPRTSRVRRARIAGARHRRGLDQRGLDQHSGGVTAMFENDARPGRRLLRADGPDGPAAVRLLPIGSHRADD